MTTVTINMTMPKASPGSWVPAGALDSSVTITFYANDINMQTKKEMIKTALPTVKSKHGDTDIPRGFIIDLDKCMEVITIKGWIEDDATYSAWEKIWMLRAMCTTGGPLTNLTVGGKQFTSSTMVAFLESMIWTLAPDDMGAIQTAESSKLVGRAHVELIFVLISEEK